MYNDFNYNVNPNLQPKAKNNPQKTILIVAIVIAALVFFYFIGAAQDNTQKNKLIGNWECQGNVTIKINKDKTFEMNYGGGDYARGNYSLQKTNSDSDTKYNLTMTSSDRRIDGTYYNTSYTVKYEVTMDGKDAFVMINPATYNIYYCDR